MWLPPVPLSLSLSPMSPWCGVGQGPWALELVEMKFEVEVARAKGIKFKRPLVCMAPTSLLVLGVQGILAGVELLPHLCEEKGR